MKKIFLLFTVLFGIIINASTQESIVKDVFEKFVEDKISSIQKVIPITEEQAMQIKDIELNFLLDVNSAENCWWCNTKKRIKRLEDKKEKQLKEVLSLDQYIKYDALENDKINRHPIWLE